MFQGKKTIQNLVYIFGKLIENFFVEKCERKFVDDGDLLRLDCSIKPGLKTKNFKNLAFCLGRTGCLLKLELTKSNESGHEYKRILKDILEIRKEKCDPKKAIPDFVFDNSEIGESAMINLVKESYPEPEFEEQISKVFVAGCPVHPLMKLTEKNGENGINSNHIDAKLFIKCMRIHQHRFSYLEKEDTINYIEKIRGISVNVPSF